LDLNNLIVHDRTPAYAGVLFHLLSVATSTPVLAEKIGNDIKVVLLGDADMETPLTSMVVSETVNVSRFDRSQHQGRDSCILSITGCDIDLLKSAGLCDASFPTLSLPYIWSLREQFDAQSYSSFGEFAKQYSRSPKAVSEFFSDRFEQHCHDVEQTALFIADCVTALTRVIYQIDKVKKTSLI
jgi:hypothetical protein